MTTPTVKTFTADEANRMLPLLRTIVADILKAGNDMKAMSRETMTGEHASRLEVRINELKSYLHELEDLGCTYRDWDFKAGVVDFPAEIDGQSAFLCWRSDEPAVSYYYFGEQDRDQLKLLPAHSPTTTT